MAQADQTVQNNTFLTVRADINNNLAALFSKNSGTTAPSTTTAFMDWIDTSGANPIWKKRNAANNAWITLGTIVSNTIAFEGTLPSQSGNSGKFLTTNGTVASWASVTSGGQLLRAPQILTSGTTYTTPADCTKIYVECVGGGGGAQGSNQPSSDFYGNGGQGAGFVAKFFAVTASTAYTYAIGAGGIGGANFSQSGTAGGNTTFTVGGTTITANGGGNGAGSPGVGVNGDIVNRGGFSVAPGPGGGRGGDSFFALGGDAIGNGSNGNAGGIGAGGSGANSFGVSGSRTGGNGGNGLIRIWEYS